MYVKVNVLSVLVCKSMPEIEHLFGEQDIAQFLKYTMDYIRIICMFAKKVKLHNIHTVLNT